MMHDASHMLGGNKAQVGSQREWPLGTTGLSAGIHLQSQHGGKKKKKKKELVECETMKVILCERQDKMGY